MYTSNVNNGNQARSNFPAPAIATPQQQQQQQQPSAAVSTLPIYKAIYPFESQEGGEVSFQKDDTMEIVEKDENGWWLARINGKDGWVPSNYLEECVAPKPPPLPPAPPARRRVPPPVPQQQQSIQQPTSQHQPEPVAVNRMSQYGDAVSVMPGVGGPTTNGVPAWRAALNAKNAAANNTTNDTTPTTANRGPPVPAKPSISTSRPTPDNSRPTPSIPRRPQAAPSPQAPPRNSSPAALSLADAVSIA